MERVLARIGGLVRVRVRVRDRVRDRVRVGVGVGVGVRVRVRVRVTERDEADGALGRVLDLQDQVLGHLDAVVEVHGDLELAHLARREGRGGGARSAWVFEWYPMMERAAAF